MRKISTAAAVAFTVLFTVSVPLEVVAQSANVLTYHNDVNRTGWNPQETILSPASVSSATFGRLVTVPLDDQVDAQPLVIAQQNVRGLGLHSVVYVATESNTVYGIDGNLGAVLLKRSLGAPVPKPLGCDNNGPSVGINGTPTIDLASHTLYVVAYVLVNGHPQYELHALDLESLEDRMNSPVVISAGKALQGNSLFTFDAQYERQRPALLDSNGRIYVGFGSFCDFHAEASRGWILSWDKASFASPADGTLSNLLPASTSTSNCTYPLNRPCFLSSLWMSGFGPASDDAGDIYFTTGNSANGSYDSSLNISESIARFSQALALKQVFTPSNVNQLDQRDNDLGSGGVMILPEQAGAFPHLAVAAGKDGRLFVLNRDNLGGHQSVDSPIEVQIGHCFCGPSYFMSDAGPRVVTSGGSSVILWTPSTTKVTTVASPTLTQLAVGAGIEAGQGFFTSISSDGTKADSGMIWAVGRAAGADHHITLYAYSAAPNSGALTLLWSGVAGSWSNTGGFSNIAPTIANGHVYVASDIQLQIFGIGTPSVAASAFTTRPSVTESRPISATPSTAVLFRSQPGVSSPRFWGTVTSVTPDRLMVKLRNGKLLAVDPRPAVGRHTAKIVGVGQAVSVVGTFEVKTGIFKATVINEAKDEPQSWGTDYKD
jgi:hypothetical protein